MTTPAGMRANERPTSLQAGNEQLLPGIPDEITLDHIVPRLPWKAFYILSTVSRAWFDGIRTRQVYDARVLSQSTETLSVVSFWSVACCRMRIGLCSMREDPMPSKSKYAHIHRTCTGLPPIPSVDFQYVSSDGYIDRLAAWGDFQCGSADEYIDRLAAWDDFQCVSSDGYIYVLAAWDKDFSRNCSNKVFVFDVAGQILWKECASLSETRAEFGCGVMHGKLYVFGGLLRKRRGLNLPTFCGSEVYDPKEDCWSPIRPMTTWRYGHKVETVGDELFVHGGYFFDRDHYNANFLEVYHPVKDEWRVVNPFGRDSRGYLFAAGGKFYSIDASSIHVYEAENSWAHLHSFSFPTTGSADLVMGNVSSAIVVDGELLVHASWSNAERFVECVFQSKGFGGKSEEIMWEKAPQFHIRSAGRPKSSNQLIQL